ncbi:MAG: serine hydrolase domain-containing protein [Silvibacterium sp.]
MRKLALLLLIPAFLAPIGLHAQSNLPAIRSFYESGLHKNGIIGSSLVLIRNGNIVLHDNYGQQSLTPAVPVDDNTTWHWASCTKTLTGIAIMQLRDRGLLSLDDPAVKYIPELAAVHDPYGPISAVTIRQLMAHSAGFRDPTWPWHDQPWQPFEPTKWSQIVAMLPYTQVLFPPGSRFSYSNLGWVFLGEIIQRLSGDNYEVYMEKNVLRPLGMTRSYFDRSPYYLLPYRSHSWDIVNGKRTEDEFNFDTGITRSNGGLNAPVPDMLKYIQFLLGDPAHPDRYDVILKRSSLEEMWKPVNPITPDPDFASRAGAHDDVTAGFVQHTDGKLRLIGKAGWQNGFRSHFYIDPAARNAYIVVYNTDAQDPQQNTRTFDFQFRDHLIDNFFNAQTP